MNAEIPEFFCAAVVISLSCLLWQEERQWPVEVHLSISKLENWCLPLWDTRRLF